MPGFGKPCAAIDEPLTANDWLNKKIKRERLSALPPALQIKYDIEQTLGRLRQLNCESQVVRQLELLNERVRCANLSSTWARHRQQWKLTSHGILFVGERDVVSLGRIGALAE